MTCAVLVCFCKQKTAYEMRISDWSSDVCSSDLSGEERAGNRSRSFDAPTGAHSGDRSDHRLLAARPAPDTARKPFRFRRSGGRALGASRCSAAMRSEEHTSELQSLMRISYAVFCLKKKKKIQSSKHPNIK